MSSIVVALSGFAAMLLLMLLRVPIAAAMAITGVIGTAMIADWDAAFYVLRSAPFERASSYTFLTIPLFLLMGYTAARSGLSRDLFRVANVWFGHWRGGLAISAVFSSALFGAISGSSLATVAAVCTIVLPEMRRYAYSNPLALGSIAAGGTLGIMIPPSIIFILFAIITETSPAALLLAGIVPGIIGLILFMIVIMIWVRLRPGDAPAGERHGWKERFRSLLDIWQIVILFAAVIGSLYAGVATPTEAAAFGAIGTILLGMVRRSLSIADFKSAVFYTTATTAMIFLIIIGADLFSFFIALTQMPMEVAQWFSQSGLSTASLLVGIFVIYLLLGAVMDEISMLLLTLPVFFPLVTSLQVDPIWFGVMVVLVCQIGMLTPPVGMNAYIVSGFAKDVPIQTIFAGVLPFVAALIVLAAILSIWPGLPSLILPG